MFMPIASPVVVANRMNKVRPAIVHFNRCKRAKREVDSKASLRIASPSVSIHRLATAAAVTEGKSIAGPRVMASPMISVDTPPPAFKALHPREVDATSVPSAVAIGM